MRIFALCCVLATLLIVSTTSAQASCTANGMNVNIRQNPGREQPLVGSLNGAATIIGSAPDATGSLWWNIGNGWVASWVVTVSGDCSTITPSTAPTTSAESPTRGNSVVVPSVGIDLPLIICALNSDGTDFDMSQVWRQACFLEHRERIDDPNNSVPIIIAAHYDFDNGSPAAFWSLKQVVIGDQIHVFWQGVQYTYVVTAINIYSMYDKDPVLYGNNCLSLMTSHGRDLSVPNSYHSQRWLVTACTRLSN